MSNYKLTFKLKQHTPIIHFQHDQHGATLRATEVKPKLDRFLIDKLKLTQIIHENGKKKEVPKNEYKKWFINEGKEHLALDYKLRFEPVLNKSYYLFFSFLNNDKKKNLANYIKDNKLINKTDKIDVEVIAPSPYFANNDKVKFNGDSIDSNRSKFEELRYGVLANENISGVITSFNKHKCQVSLNNQTYKDITLLEIVHKVLPEFFLVHNFGTRQNKGFGSFSISSINGKTSSNIVSIEFFKQAGFVFSRKINLGNRRDNRRNIINDKISAIFKKIDNHYKKLKNNPAQNTSAIRDYFSEKGIVWEKPKITKELIKKEKAPSNNYKYVRALLGLAELHDYQQFKKKVKIEHDESNKDKKIERFQSPIMYKVIGNDIYLLVPKQTNLDKIQGKKFWFYTTDKLKDASDDQKLLLPVPTEFDIVDFLNNALKNRSHE